MSQVVQALVFIDANVSDIDHLIHGVRSGYQIYVIDSERDGVEQITSAIQCSTFTVRNTPSKEHGAERFEVHIISHGAPGSLQLGNTQLDLATLHQYASSLETWFAVPEEAAISPYLYLYGCHVAAGDAGEEFLSKLQVITGAEIAASTSPVGNSDKGGNWYLDAMTEMMAQPAAIAPSTQLTYAGTFEDVVTDATGSSAIPDNDTVNGLAIVFDLTAQPPGFTVDDMTLGLNLEHVSRGHIQVDLEAPDGTTVTLINSIADGHDDFDILLGDAFTGPIDDDSNDATSIPLYERRVRPSNPFSAFQGKTVQGEWILRIFDTALGATGTFNQAQLTITPADTSNELPTFSAIDDPVIYAENSTSSVITVTVTDADSDPISFLPLSGADANQFTLTTDSNGTATLTPQAAIDLESGSSADGDDHYEVTITATDGKTFVPQDVSIQITDVNDQPTGSIAIASDGSPGFQSGDVLTATPSLVDQEGLTTATFSYDWQTSLDGTTGWTSLSAPDQNTYTLSTADVDAYIRVVVSYTDDASFADNSFASTPTIQITGVPNEPPVFDPQSPEDFIENTVGTALTVSAIDADTPIAYALDGAIADNALFDINSSTGAVTFLAAPDFEAPQDTNLDNNYEIQVKATDDLGASSTETFVITVVDGNDVPDITSLVLGQTVAWLEDTDYVFSAAAGNALTINDGDANDTFRVVLSVPNGDGTITLGNSVGINAINDGTNVVTIFNATQAQVTAALDGLRYKPLGDFVGSTTLTVNVADGAQLSDQDTVTFDIQNVNDPALISGTFSGSVTEGAQEIATGTVSASDIDAGDTGTFVAIADAVGSYGTFSLSAAGEWQYTYTAELPEGISEIETFDIETDDGTTGTITLNVTGVNDDPVITGETDISGIQEDNTSFITGELTVADADGEAESMFVSQSDNLGIYGFFSISATGSWTYILDNSRAETAAIAAGQIAQDIFEIETIDGTTQTFTINIEGTEDQPQITGDFSGNVKEETVLSTTGRLIVVDADTNESFFQPIASSDPEAVGTYGTFTMDADGNWNYVLENSEAVNALPEGNFQEDTFTVTTQDGTTKAVTLSIEGSNDSASISLLDGDKNTVAIAEDETTPVTGTLSIQDADTGEAVFQPIEAETGNYGIFSITTGGQWTYALETDVSDLPDGASETETFTVSSKDGTASETITITIAGSNNDATISSDGPGESKVGEVTEDITLTATGRLSVADADLGEASFLPVTDAASDSKYGTFSMDASGNWTYILNNDLAAVQEMGTAGTLSDSFTVTSADGSATETVSLTIRGVNDQPIVDAALTASYSEDQAGTFTLDLLMGASDVESDSLSVTNLLPSEAIAGIELDGTQLKITPTAYAALPAGGIETVTYTYDIADDDGGSTPQTATLTFEGLNNAPVINGTIDVVPTEDDAAFTLDLTSVGTDPDSSDTLTATFVNVTSGDAKGIVFNGSTLNVDPNAYDSLAEGSTEVIEYSYRLTDGIVVVKDLTAKITVTGVNDVASISGDVDGSVLEDEVDNSDNLTTTGTLTILDPDAGEAQFQTTVTGGTYGSLTLASTGEWTYTVANSTAEIGALGADDTLTDTFTATSEDGTATQDIVVTIQGTSDSAIIDGVATGEVAEDAFPNTLIVTDQLTITDSDTDEAKFKPATLAGEYGTLTITEDGTWEYSADNTQAAVQSLGGIQESDPADAMVEVFTVESVDGTSQDIEITITGVDDAPEIGGDSSGEVTEDDGVNPEGQIKTTGQLAITDVDFAEDAFMPESVTGGLLGSLAIQSNGTWTYTVDNSATEIQTLTTGEHLTEEFTVKSVDGTETTLTLKINGFDDAAAITGDTFGFVVEDDKENSQATGDLTISDVDSANPKFATITTEDAAAQGLYGTFEIDENGSWIYTLDNDITETDVLTEDDQVSDTFTVSALDGTSSTVEISIFGANDGPVLDDLSTTVLEIVAIEDETIANIPRSLFTQGFTDPEGDPLSMAQAEATPFIDSETGTLVDNGNGTLTFTPATNFNGEVTVTYVVTDGEIASEPMTKTFMVANVNDAPESETGPTETVPDTDEDTAITFDISKLTTGFSDADGDALNIADLTVSSGSIVDNGDGTIAYTPESNFNGPVTLAYSVIDGNGGKHTGITQDFEVLAINDLPTGTPDPSGMGDALEDEPFIIEREALTAGFTDADGDVLTVTALVADLGTVSEIEDGTGPFTYTPIEDYVGPVALTYSLTDGNGGKVNNQTTTFNVLPTNDAPTGTPTGDIADGVEDTPVIIQNSTLTEGFEDIDGDELFAIAVTPSVEGDLPTGTLQNNEDGTFTYTPAENVHGVVTLTYRVTDDNGGNSDEVTRTFTLQPQNDAPTGETLLDTLDGTLEDVPFDIAIADLLDDFRDIDGDELIVKNLTASDGSLTLQEDSYRFTPTEEFTGPVTLTYDVSDGQVDIPGVTRTFEVTSVNDEPTGSVTISGSPEEDTTLTVNIAGLDDADGLSTADFAYQWQMATAQGVEPNDDWQNIDGAVEQTFTPGDSEVGFFLRAIATYQDDAGFSQTVTSEPTVQAIGNVNDAPSGAPTGTLPAGLEDTPVTILSEDLLIGFVDTDGNETLSISTLTGTNGSVDVDGDNFIFTPDADYVGPVTLTYSVQDDAGTTLEDQVQLLEIAPVNDAPTVTALLEISLSEDDAPLAIDLLTGAVDIDDGDILGVDFPLSAETDGLSLEGTTLTFDPGVYDALPEGENLDLAFDYSIVDSGNASVPQTLKVEITGKNDAPEGEALGQIPGSLQDVEQIISGALLLEGFSDVDEGSVLSVENIAVDVGAIAAGENGNFVFTPEPDHTGFVQVSYDVTDGSSSIPAMQTFEVKSDKVPPVVFNLSQYVRFNLLDEGIIYTGPSLDLEVGDITLSAIFDEMYYLNANPSVAAAVGAGAFNSGFDHFVNFGLTEGRNPSLYYDEDFYLSQNPDVQAGITEGFFDSGLLHYLEFGHKEFRDASPTFDFNEYVNSNPDLADAIKAGDVSSGFEHYVEIGAAEGRQAGALYEEGFYLTQNPEVVAAVTAGAFESGYEHYILFGQHEGRSPSSSFNEAAYLGSNPDIAEAVDAGIFSSGMEHFFRFGRAEDRPQFTPENLSDF